ncbi:MAG: DUF3783 domain-containing protein [Spirochaetes bacterium]|jgi:hypothetical protein|nr:DUF3783 domain-containing protein [Spirochaetota bacterium]
MEPLGIMLYGYAEHQAIGITASLKELLGRDVILISASGGEDETVEEILDSDEAPLFEEREDHVLMFLGFGESEISLAMDRFPKGGGIPRPIFCGLTEENHRWKLSYLLEHLLEEHRRWNEPAEKGERG